MGLQTVSKIEEQNYVLNKILYPNKQNTNLMPQFLITTTSVNFDRSKVLATISYDGNVFGEMLIFLLKRKNGFVDSHEFVGKAGFHVLGQLQSHKLKEFIPGEEDNKTVEELANMEISMKNVNSAINEHLTRIQEKAFGMGQSK